MPVPANAIQIVAALHRAYCARTGYTIIYNLHRENQWRDWLAWSDWTWTEEDLARVIGYLRPLITKGERRDGALRFDNLIGDPAKFEGDLEFAREAAKKKARTWGGPTKQDAPVTPAQPDAPLDPGEAAALWREQMAKPLYPTTPDTKP